MQMRTTLILDDALLCEARLLADIIDLGGTQPDLADVPRRRSEPVRPQRKQF
jgi:hypothetical protein